MEDKELLGYILNTPHDNMTNEEIIHLLLENTVSDNREDKETFGQRAADKMAAFAGSAFLRCRRAGAAHYDESAETGAKRPPPQ